MATAERIRAVSQLMLQDKPESRVVVVSAMGSAPGQPIKVTDLILNMIKKAAAKVSTATVLSPPCRLHRS